MARKKKDEDEDLPLYLWLRSYTKKLVPARPLSMIPRTRGRGNKIVREQIEARAAARVSGPLPFAANRYILRQVFNIPAYIIYGTLLPTPLEQIAFAKDPLGITPPYVWKGGLHAILDLSATVGDPFGMARSQLQSPHEAVFGRPNPNYWFSEEGMEMTELFLAAGN